VFQIVFVWWEGTVLYFVLGNHDLSHGDITTVRAVAAAMGERSPHLSGSTARASAHRPATSAS
jgi:hypothetical protein